MKSKKNKPFSHCLTNEARFVDKKSGKLKAVKLEKTDKGIRALTPLAHLSAATLILK